MADNRELTDSASTTWDGSTPNQAKVHIASKVFQVADAPSGGNDTVALQAKIDALALLNGGTLYIPVGTYLASNLNPCNNLRITGAGRASVIKQNGTQSAIRVNTADALRENIILEDLSFDGNKSALTVTTGSDGCTVKLERQKGAIVRNCYFYNSVQAGLLLGNPGDATGGAFIVTDNIFLNCSKIGSGGWGPISIVGGDSVLAIGNVCENTDGGNSYGIKVDATTGLFNRRVMVSNNTLLRGSIKTAGAVQDLIISNNFINSQNITGSPSALDISVSSGSLNISDNLIIAPVDTNPGISVGGTPARAMVINNVVAGLGSTQNTYPNLVGIYISSTGVVNAIIKDNHIDATAATHASTVAGIKFVSGFDTSPASLTVEGNTFRNVAIPFATGIFQNGDVVSTASLPAASASHDGKWCIEDGGPGS